MNRQRYSDPKVREICHGIKDRDEQAMKEMASYVLNRDFLRKGDIIIPAPQHEGCAIYTLEIARMIERETGVIVLDILRGEERVPLYDLKVRGIAVPKVLFRSDKAIIPDGSMVYFLDNVVSTGTTWKAAEKAVGRSLIPVAFGYTDRAEQIFC